MDRGEQAVTSWLIDRVVLPLLIAIFSTAIGSGSIFLLCHFLYNRMKERRRSHAREAGTITPSYFCSSPSHLILSRQYTLSESLFPMV